LFGKPGAGFVKPLDGGFQLGGRFLVRQKLDLQDQFHGGALYIQISSIPSNLRNSSPSKSLRKAYAIVDGESLRGEVDAITVFICHLSFVICHLSFVIAAPHSSGNDK
jgi:hypothetical protein